MIDKVYSLSLLLNLLSSSNMQQNLVSTISQSSPKKFIPTILDLVTSAKPVQQIISDYVGFEYAPGKKITVDDLGRAGTSEVDYRPYILQYSPNGKYLLLGSSDYILIIDADTRHIIKKLSKQNAFIYTATFSSSGQFIATGEADGNLYIWSTNDFKLIKNKKISEHGIAEIVFSPDDKYIALVAFPDQILRSSDLEQETNLSKLLRFEDKFVFSPQSNSLISYNSEGHYKKYIESLQLSTKKKKKSAPLFQHQVDDDEFIRSLLSDLNTPFEIIRELTGNREHLYIYHIRISPDGKNILVSMNDKTLRLLNAETLKTIYIIELPGEARELQYLPDGKHIAFEIYLPKSDLPKIFILPINGLAKKVTDQPAVIAINPIHEISLDAKTKALAVSPINGDIAIFDEKNNLTIFNKIDLAKIPAD